MAPNRTGVNDTKDTVQWMNNQSFDREFNVNAVEVLGFNPTSNTLERLYPSNALNLKTFDYMSMVIAPTTTETYTFKSGGSGGTTTNTVVVVYTDATRTDISTITKT